MRSGSPRLARFDSGAAPIVLPAGDELRAGYRFGVYAIEEVLGAGAMGVVFRAKRDDGVVVALKVLRRELSHDETYSRRFEREARAARAVEHRHLVRVLDAGEVAGRSYLAVDYLRGGSLDDRLRAAGRLGIDDVVRLAADVGAGLDALHRAGLVHRDVKPANIMLDTSGSAALTDFGLARGPAYTVLTKPGVVVGTIDYLAPELVHGDQASPASDVYALGCVAYECLTGTPPFRSDNVLETIAGHVDAEPPDSRSLRAELPLAFAAALLLALAKDPRDRPSTARAYAQLLGAARDA